MLNMFQIDKKTGKLAKLLAFQADFAEENPSINHAAISLDNTLLATAGDDKAVRVYKISSDFKKNELELEFKKAEQPVVSVDISRNNKLLVAGSKDGNAYIIDLTKKGEICQKLTFKPAPNQRNMKIQSCLFDKDNTVYTLATWPQMPSYVIRWQGNSKIDESNMPTNWNAAITKEVHHKPSTGMRASYTGKLCVMTSDGYVCMLDL